MTEIRTSTRIGLTRADQARLWAQHNRPLAIAAAVLLSLMTLAVLLVGVHEVTGWAGPWGSIEWLHMHSPLGTMALATARKWCWG